MGESARACLFGYEPSVLLVGSIARSVDCLLEAHYARRAKYSRARMREACARKEKPLRADVA
eukprot:2945301-Lingulodinium_polyedra.AAC.1